MSAKVATVQDYIGRLDPERRAAAKALRELIRRQAADAEEVIAWGQPWWKLNGWLCTVYPAGDHINFGFMRGAELDDPDGLLEGSGKGMRHIKVIDKKDIKKTKFAALLKQAVRLNLAPAKKAG